MIKGCSGTKTRTAFCFNSIVYLQSLFLCPSPQFLLPLYTDYKTYYGAN